MANSGDHGFLDAGTFVFYILNGQIPPRGLIFAVAVAAVSISVWGHRLWAVYALAIAELLEFSAEWVVSGSVPSGIGPFVSLAGARSGATRSGMAAMPC
jgi:hypothetical protein